MVFHLPDLHSIVRLGYARKGGGGGEGGGE